MVIRAPMQATVLSLEVAEGETVAAGQPILVLSAMKMEHVIEAPSAGVVKKLSVAPGETVNEKASLATLEPGAAAATTAARAEESGAVKHRADLAEVDERHAKLLDAARPDAVARRRKTGQRTVRENL